MNLNEIGWVIKVERKRRSLSQKDLAIQLNVNQSTISRIEKGDESINIDLYEQLLKSFSIHLTELQPNLEPILYEMYELLELAKTKAIKELYKRIEEYTELDYKNYYLKLLIKANYLLYMSQYEQLKELIHYLDDFLPLLKGKVRFIYFIMKGYAYHTTRDYLTANSIFKDALELGEELGITDGILLYIYSYNTIILRRYRLAELLVLKLMDYYTDKGNSYRLLTAKRLLGMVYYFDGNYHDTISVFKECLEEQEYISKAPALRLSLNSYIGYSYLALKKYEHAIPYFELNILNKSSEQYLEYYYAYLLYCLKQTNDLRLDTYITQAKQESIYKDPTKRAFIDLFQTTHGELDLRILETHFHLLNEHVFIHDDRYQHTRFIFSNIKNELWKNRKYSLYKQLNDIIVRHKIGGFENGI